MFDDEDALELLSLTSPPQIQLARELFAQGSPDLLQAFDKFQDGRAGSDLENLMRLIYKSAQTNYPSARKQAEATRGREYMSIAEHPESMKAFWNLLATEPPPSDNALTAAFIQRNQIMRDECELEALWYRVNHQFIAGLAQKARLEIVKKGYGRFDLVRNNTPPPQKSSASA